MRNKETTGSFESSQAISDQEAEVLGEKRKVKMRNGRLEDHYNPNEPPYLQNRHATTSLFKIKRQGQ